MEKGKVAKAAIDIHAPLSSVWDALINPDKIRRYMFGTHVSSEWKVGSEICFKGEWKGKLYEDKGKILKLEPGKIFSYSHFSPMSGAEDKPENYHTVTIALASAGDVVRVQLTQDNNHNDEEQKHSEQNWSAMLNEMKSLLERAA